MVYGVLGLCTGFRLMRQHADWMGTVARSPNKCAQAVIDPKSLAVYLPDHQTQGPVLHQSLKLP